VREPPRIPICPEIEVEKDYIVVVKLAEIDAFFAEIREIDVEALGFSISSML